jgi:hypothetical protein
MYISIDHTNKIVTDFYDILVSSNASVVSSTISSIDVLGEDLTNQKFGRLYRRWLKCANRTMKQNPRQVKQTNIYLHNQILYYYLS